ncbi:3',5'-cyclic-AMP phosphodiesterase [Vibrio sp. ZSDE26]|uniref:3',5'-cyclic adenosine monophosphate phosphodiesterase CpdA n=1 Tax=Vibrio amylolyticus TaxID=2847292 RepID=A0A9X1XSM6_9VIBR|nr:3',5'-cyclic-AMP phosphodiesterase [Vibrio amylolyticus]MCK6264789.1 3',5'-cyclic-AMP phosphodiesterase [Vibrio amylolyticus]
MKLSSSTARSTPIKLLQITDTHLFAPANGSLLSVTTLDSFRAVVAKVEQSAVKFEAILATGDISQDHSVESYQRFANGIAPLKKPCYWLPGNHDFKPNMGSVFPSSQIEHLEHLLVGEHWQIIMLDSQVVGMPHGRLSDRQLSLLDQHLSDNLNRHTLVLLHHHPVLVGSAWLDQHTLKDSDLLWQVINKHDNVKAMLCGHVHQDMDREVNGVRVIATPSTCIQFKPNSDDFALDRCSPGWRELDLYPDGQLVTKVERLADDSFLPDFTAGGY